MKTMKRNIITIVLTLLLIPYSYSQRQTIVNTKMLSNKAGYLFIRATFDNATILDFYVLKNNNSVKVHATPNQEYRGHVYIPETIKHNGVSYSVIGLDDYAFHNCEKMTAITLPYSIKEISYLAFCNCRNLTSITIPYGVTLIDDRAFAGCDNLASITIPGSVTIVKSGAFRSCKNLTSVIIQNPNLQIDFEKVFEGCEKLQRSNVIYASGSGSASNPSSVSTPTSAKSKVYSNAYDGFVNIRQTPQSKAPILGVLRNGPEGAILLGTEGEWKKIDCNGIVGYVYEKYVQDTPTEVFHGE